MEMGEELEIERGAGMGCVEKQLLGTCDLYRLSGAQVTKCGTVGERATDGLGHSAQPQRVTSEMLLWVTHRQQTAKRHQQINGLVLQISRELSQRCLEINKGDLE